MKKIWRHIPKSLRVIIVVILLLNIGYWDGAVLYNAQVKVVTGQKINFFEQVLLGPKSKLTALEEEEIGPKTNREYRFGMIAFWPVHLMAVAFGWTFAGYVHFEK